MPGFNGKLLGRRNFVLAVVVVIVVDVGGGFSIGSSPFSFASLLVVAGSTNVGIAIDDEVVVVTAATSICNGDVAPALKRSCFGRMITSGFGIKFSKLKWRNSVLESVLLFDGGR